jgi:hypothetical protein
MSVIDNLRRKPTSAAPLIQAPDISQRLVQAQAELERLQGQHGDVALDALLSIEGADARLTVLEKQIASARADVQKLQSAHKAALSRDEATILQQRASLYKTQMATVRRKLEARDQAAQELQGAFGTVARAWTTMIEASKAAKAATPAGTTWPEDALPAVIDFDGIKLLVANEMYRQAGDPALGNKFSFPGGRPTPGNEGQPDKIRPLVDSMKAHTAFVLEKLTGKAPGA